MKDVAKIYLNTLVPMVVEQTITKRHPLDEKVQKLMPVS
jgi:hypothetical protein